MMPIVDVVANTIINYLKGKGRATIQEIHDHVSSLTIDDPALASAVSFSGKYSSEVDDAIEEMMDQGFIRFDGIACYFIGSEPVVMKKKEIEPGVVMMANDVLDFVSKACIQSPGEKIELHFIVDRNEVELHFDNPRACGLRETDRSWRVPVGLGFGQPMPFR